jgi:hypothetical protein
VIVLPLACIRQRFTVLRFYRSRASIRGGEDRQPQAHGARPRAAGSRHIDQLSQRLTTRIRGPPICPDALSLRNPYSLGSRLWAKSQGRKTPELCS